MDDRNEVETNKSNAVSLQIRNMNIEHEPSESAFNPYQPL
jgi:hypothetical protein